MACTCVICNEYENKLVFYHLKTRHSTTVVKVLFNLLQFLSDAPIRDFADYFRLANILTQIIAYTDHRSNV